MQAVVLAGQANEGRLRDAAPVSHEALIPLAGRPMVDYVLDALRESPSITAITVVGPPLNRSGVTVIDPGSSLFENVERGLRDLPPDEPVLVATADIPLLTAPVVETFLEEASRLGAVDMIYPIIPQASIQSRWPGVQRTYFRFQEGVYTGGNLFLVRPRVAGALRARAERLIDHRKSPLKLARDIGYFTLMKFLLGRLSIREVELRAGSLLDLTGRALVFLYPEVGVDVDKPSDLSLVVSLLAGGAGDA